MEPTGGGGTANGTLPESGAGALRLPATFRQRGRELEEKLAASVSSPLRGKE